VTHKWEPIDYTERRQNGVVIEIRTRGFAHEVTILELVITGAARDLFFLSIEEQIPKPRRS
jgi:hypothetical protein